MIINEYSDLFYKDNVNKQAVIEYSGGVMTNEELFQNSEELTESLCSESELLFGSCEASSFKFKVANVLKPMEGENIKFSIRIDHREPPFPIGQYKVLSDTLTADRRYREVVAYDAMYDIINADVADWYNTVLPAKDSTVTLKQFRESFVRHFGLTEVVPEGGLVNDDMIIEKTIDIVASSESESETGQKSVIGEVLSGRDVITSICEINGCFGHIGRDGKFHYIYLLRDTQGVYPADFLYPDHVPEKWDYLSQADTGHLYPQSPADTIQKIGSYIKCQYADYMVRSINKLQIRQKENDIGVVVGDGDNGYVIEDNFLVYGKNDSDLLEIANKLFSKIKGVVYCPFDATCVGNPCLEIGDVVRFKTKYDIFESYIFKRTLKGIQALRDTFHSGGSKKRPDKVNGIRKSIIQLKGMTNTLERTVEENKLEIINIEQGLSSKIQQNADAIIAEVKRAQGQEVELAAAISVNADNIGLKVSKGDVSSQLSIESGQVVLSSNRFVLESTNCSISANGKITAREVELKGKIEALSGTIGGFTITHNSIYYKKQFISSSDFGVYIGTDGISIGTGNNFFADTTGGVKLGSYNNSVNINGSIDIKQDVIIDLGKINFKSFNSTSGHILFRDNKAITFDTNKSTLHNDCTFEKGVSIGSNLALGTSSYIQSGSTNVMKLTTAGTHFLKNIILDSSISIKYGEISSSTLIDFTSSRIKMNSDCTVGGSGKYVGFFGNTGSTKKTVSIISSTSSATASKVAIKVNEIINALKAYNLL